VNLQNFNYHINIYLQISYFLKTAIFEPNLSIPPILLPLQKFTLILLLGQPFHRPTRICICQFHEIEQGLIKVLRYLNAHFLIEEWISEIGIPYYGPWIRGWECVMSSQVIEKRQQNKIQKWDSKHKLRPPR
jgi:hypothetical protein